MIKTAVTTTTPSRKIEFIGNHKDDSIVIGNYGDVKFIARGNFDLSGLIYCMKNTVEISVEGDGIISFKGVCKKLMIRGIYGNCTLDLSQVTSKRIWCESVRGNAIVNLGPTKIIELISLGDEAIVRYEGRPALLNYSLKDRSKIEGWIAP
jgi:hypothetical protein